ncbi:hypothetical protein niasHT_031193 [Heterodera trifolii]|uniref:Uncharacterized protein n=1 Tax=Heterodera trifolii TaxID=157864 RepID=A0ABD2I7R9_9BILA
MNTKIVLFLLLPLLIIGWVTPTNTTKEKRTNKGKGLQRSAEGSAFSAYKPQQKDNGKIAENEQKNETDGQQRADTTGDNEQLQVVAARDDDQHRAISAGDVDLQHVEAVAEPMEVSADGSRSAQTLKPSGGGDGSTSSRRKSGGHQSPLGRHEDAQRSSEATLSADTATAGNNGGAENDDHEMGERAGEAQKQTPMKRRLIKQKTMEKSSKRSAAEKKKNADSVSARVGQ